MRSSPSLALRATLAVALMIGFYLLALGIVAGLLLIPYAQMVYLHQIYFRLTLFCLVGAGVILFSIFPRPDRFVPPGPRLGEVEHPRLFHEVCKVAEALDQTMPTEIYLVPQVNAWVSQRGGMMGFGSRRIMGLGLPLLQLLSVSELRAVMAHEFGHYHGGDTKLGPWIYKTRAAIGRTLRELSVRSSALQKPFAWYGNLFLRITHAISRRQEYSADALAARAEGARPLAHALRVIHGSAGAFDSFWRSEVVPVLSAGFCPALAEGFTRFLRAKSIEGIIVRNTEAAMEQTAENPYETHPPLRERIAAIQGLPSGPEPSEDPVSLSLLDNVPGLETQMLASLYGESRTRELKEVEWSEVGKRVYLPGWCGLVNEFSPALGGLTPASLPDLAKETGPFRERIRKSTPRLLSDEDLGGLIVPLIGAALVLLLEKEGWLLDTAPGETVSMTRGEASVEPFSILPRLASGLLSADEWQRRCADLGISDKDMGSLVTGHP